MLPLFILHVVIYQVDIVLSFGQVTKVFSHLFLVILTILKITKTRQRKIRKQQKVNEKVAKEKFESSEL